MNLSELRQDPISGDWIAIAPGRGKRPHSFANSVRRKRAQKKGCPFENPRTLDHRKPFLQINDKNGWFLQIVENKFPAFVHRDLCATIGKRGPYAVTPGIGHHEVLITRDHDADLSDLSVEQATEVFQALQDRYLMLIEDKCLEYVSIFHNWGSSAGASVYHPHYQLIAIPVVPPDFMHSLRGAADYYRRHKECVHCLMLAWELKDRKRVIFENRHAIAFAPFVSRSAFEIRVFPKRHLPFFENTGEVELAGVVEALRNAVLAIKRRLKDPDYNFFIHTAPMRRKDRYGSYHWHIEVLPKVTVDAGFELGTGIEINPVDPDEAARILRGR